MDDAKLRNRLAELQRAWDLLDELPIHPSTKNSPRALGTGRSTGCGGGWAQRHGLAAITLENLSTWAISLHFALSSALHRGWWRSGGQTVSRSGNWLPPMACQASRLSIPWREHASLLFSKLSI